MTGTYNLLREKWIPARRRSGKVDWIAPWQITDSLNKDPFVTLAAPRPDFNGALLEFLIGLLATAAGPRDGSDWSKKLLAPPKPESLKEQFNPCAHAFDLDGPGPRFMQDLDELKDIKEKRDIRTLLIDAPGKQTIKNNADLFVKRHTNFILSRAAAAMALYTLQTYAPQGGRGYRTSLRGGGPLTTLVFVGDTLWEKLWANVPSKDQIDELNVSGGASNEYKFIFPWLAPTITSEGNREITYKEAHPMQLFWGMPRRIRLSFSEGNNKTICTLTGKMDSLMVSDYRTKNYGAKYSGAWRHVLSPHWKSSSDSGAPWIPYHASEDRVSYRNWLGLGFISTPTQKRDNKIQTCPALNLQSPRLGRLKNKILARNGVRLMAFGYDMDVAKVRKWVDSKMPVWAIPDEVRERVESKVEGMIEAAKYVSEKTNLCIMKALSKEGKKSLFLENLFWKNTEDDFKSLVEKIIMLPQNSEEDDPTKDIRKEWLKSLRHCANRMFKEHVTIEVVSPSTERIVSEKYKLAMALRSTLLYKKLSL